MNGEMGEKLTTKRWGGVKRNSNLEVFRIITMLLIVAHHYVVNSGLMELIYEDMMAGKSIFLLLFGAWGKTGINCFVLISGYFMCKSQITVKKFAKLVLEVEFYKIIFFIIFWMSGYEKFSVTGLVKALLPIPSIAQNFTGCFLMFYLCIPFLNILLKNINELQHIRLIMLCSFIYVILGTIPKINVTMNYVTWFIVLYFIASYIRLYPKKLFEKTTLWGALTVASIFVSAASVVCCAWISAWVGKELPYYFVSDSNKILAVTTAICAFLFFKNVRIKNNRFINTVAASCFGVLLIHANSDTMRRWLWKDTLQNTTFFDSEWLVLHAILSVIGIYIICTVIDYVRISFVEQPIFKVWDKYWDKFALRLKRREQKIIERFSATK